MIKVVSCVVVRGTVLGAAICRVAKFLAWVRVRNVRPTAVGLLVGCVFWFCCGLGVGLETKSGTTWCGGDVGNSTG